MTPDGRISTAAYLHENGFSYAHLHISKERGWLDEFGRGAYCRHGHHPSLEAGLDAAHHQLQLPLHVGGRTALAHHGFLHFVPAVSPKSTLYIKRGVRIPAWFKQKFGDEVSVTSMSTLPPELGVSPVTVNGFTYLESSPERAILELLDQVPRRVSAAECYQILEMMNTLRSKLLSELLKECASVKVKRLFLMLAEAADHQWFPRVDLAGLDLGTGCRIIDPGGEFNRKYNLVVKPWREI